MTRKILEMIDVNKFYETKNEKLHIIRDLNFSIEEGDFISILGRSGSGKSTFLNLIGLIDSPNSGIIKILEKDLKKMKDFEIDKLKNEKLGYIFQFHYLLNEFTALENVMLPALLNNYKDREKIENYARELLKLVDLEERLNHKPSQLSGGEKQRVAIARALINKPSLILADEPTGNLDEETSEKIFSLLKKVNTELKQTIIVVTHSKDLASISNKQYYLKKGQLELNL